jgi:hypothetical protein
MCKKKQMNDQQAYLKLSRREMLFRAAAASGSIGLKSLLIGLPPSFIASRAMAQDSLQYLIFSESASGDPVNCNAPGSYVPGVWHGFDSDFVNPPVFQFGDQPFQAAVPWGQLSSDLRARLNFFHLRTKANAHPESAIVQTIFGSIKDENGANVESLPSAIAQELGSGLGTLQPQPISLSGRLSYRGLNQGVVQPTSLKSLFEADTRPVRQSLAQLRDQQVDELYRDLKVNGTPAQRRYMDQYTHSKSQAMKVGEGIMEALTDVIDNSEDSQVKTAVALIAMGITPVVRIELSFGGDNHRDSGLEREVTETREGARRLDLMWNELKKYSLQDRVCFAMLNVFGRTLRDSTQGSHPYVGRGHNARHNVMVSFGSKVRGGVTGGLDGLNASGINSLNGGISNPDVSPDQTHESAVKSLMSALNISDSRLEKRVLGGKIIRGYLR